MFTEKFTVFGSSLSLLQPGERGVVTRIENVDANYSTKPQCNGRCVWRNRYS